MLTQIERLYSEFQSHSAERARTHEFPLVTITAMMIKQTLMMEWRMICQWYHVQNSSQFIISDYHETSETCEAIDIVYGISTRIKNLSRSVWLSQVQTQ